MRTHGSYETRTVSKALPALRAPKGPFPRVRRWCFSRLELWLKRSPQSSLWRVRLHPQVGPLMGDEVRAATKALLTLEARVGPLTRVGSQVSDEVGALVKAFPTFCTHSLPSHIPMQEAI